MGDGGGLEEEEGARMENPKVKKKKKKNVSIVCPAWGTVRHAEHSEQSVPCVCEESCAGQKGKTGEGPESNEGPVQEAEHDRGSGLPQTERLPTV